MRKLFTTVCGLLLLFTAVKAQNVTVSATAGTAAGTYATFKAAIDSINSGYHQGTINIRIHSSTTETAAISLSASGTGAAIYASVLVRPADTATVAKNISGTITGGTLLTLNGADNITLDGRPLSTGTNRLLTLTNLGTTTNSNTLVLTAGATFNTFTFCSIINSISGTIVARAVSIGTGVNSNNTFNKLIINGGNLGFEVAGTNATPNQNITLTGCQLMNAKASSIILTTGVGTMNIDSNDIYHTVASATSGYQVINVAFIDPASTVTFTRNKAYNINISAANFIHGFFLSPSVASGTFIARNNSFTLGSAAFPNTPSQIIRGGLFTGTLAMTVIMEANTIRVGGTHVTANGQPTSSCMTKSNSAAGASFTFRNNLCINTRAGSANQHVGAFFSTPTTGTNNIDYNTYYGGPTYPMAWVTTFYPTVTAYRAAAAPLEQHSTIGLLDFVDNINPTLTPGSNNNTGSKLLGTPIPAVTTDIFGTPRSATRPYKGAYESATPIDTFDLQVLIQYTFGKIPIGTIDTVRAIVINQGALNVTNVPVNLYSTKAGYIGSTNVSLSSGDQAIINLAPYTPNIIGYDTLWAYPQPDQRGSNDTALWVRENTLNSLSYSRPFQAQTGNVGTNPDGEIVAKFTTPVPNYVNQVNVNFTNAAFSGPWPFQIVIYPDSGGNNGPSLIPIYVSATQSTVNGVFNLSLPSVPVSNVFYVGIRQTTANNVGFAYQNENPIRTNNFYFRQGTGYTGLVWNDFAVNPSNQFRFMIEPRLKINDDLGAIDLGSPGTGCVGGTNQQVRVVVQNLGLLTQSFSSHNLTVRGTATNPSNVVQNLGPVVISSGLLFSDDTLSVVMSNTYDMSAAGTYSFKFWTESTVDNNRVNDTLPTIVRTVLTANAIPVIQTFNAATTLPTGYTTNRFFISTGTGVNASNSARVELFNATPFNANAFLVSPKVTGATANTVVRFDYKMVNFADGGIPSLRNTDSIKVYVSSDCGFSYTMVGSIDSAHYVGTSGYTTYELPLGMYAGSPIVVKLQADWLNTPNDVILDIDNFRVINLTNDLSGIAATAPCKMILQNSSAFAPKAVFKNTGPATSAATSVAYVVTGPASYTGTGTTSTIPVGSTEEVTFSPVFNPTVAGTYTVKTYPSTASDDDRLNDTVYYTFIVTNPNATNAGSALSFNGATQQAEVENSATLNPSGSAITLSAWINPNSTGSIRSILSKDSSILSTQYSLYLNTLNNLGFNVTTTAGANGVLSSATIPTGVWTHVTGVYDGTTMTIYINGENVGSTTHTGTLNASGSKLRIGNNYASNFYSGLIDEVKIYNIARNIDSIRSNMHVRRGNISSTALVGYYRFDEATGTLSYDASDNCNTLSTGAAAPTWVTATYPLGSPVVDREIVSGSGVMTFTGTSMSINYTGFSGIDSVFVNKFSGLPIGTSPAVSPGGVTAVHGNYWIVYKYGTGTFSNADAVFALGNGNLSSTVSASDIKLFNRANGANGAWTTLNTAATAASFGSQTVSFSQANGSFYGKQLAIGANNNPLPVELLSFNAVAKKADAVLSWKTASELNNRGFFIERSTDGKNFTEVAFTEGKGFSSEATAYAYTDQSAFAKASAKTLYYRLRQLDNDGRFTYSNIAIVNSDAALIGGVSVYPNPFSAEVNVSVNSLSATDAVVEILDISGKTVLSGTHKLDAGANSIAVKDAAKLGTGAYIIRVSAGGESILLKLIKTN